MLRYLVAIVAAAGIGATAGLSQAQDPGAKVFEKCQACHSLDPGEARVGPSLAGILGRTAGTQPDFPYSAAMRRSGLVWSEKSLDEYLAAPWRVVPGTKMIFTGLRRPEDRAAVIAFLKRAAEHTADTLASESASPPAEPLPEATAEAAPAGTETASQPPADAYPAIDPSVPAGYVADLRYTLRSGIAEGRMVFIGVGGEIDGVINPPLTAAEGEVVQITLINGEGAEHDIIFPDQTVGSQHVLGKGASTTIAFRARAVGEFVYFCSLPGHREAGMEGKFTVVPAGTREVAETAQRDITLDPTSLPPRLDRDHPQRVRVELESVELEGRLADGTTYQYWTFNRTVPGPFIRVRVGDTVEVVLRNDPDSSMIHSVDFHAATGPGGGATHLQVEPGEEKKIEFKALVPGLYVYHCATPMVAHHITNGMYGLILVEPEGGLPPVDHEFYVMQGEIYTEAPFGTHGSQEFSVQKLLDERPEYFVLNGAVGALTTEHPMHAKVGETVRIFFGVGGPNFVSSFHVIGEIFDRVYTWGEVLTPPAQGVQSVIVPTGGSVIVDFKLNVPGRYLLVDHSLSRVERGLMGFLIVEGEENHEIYRPFSEASEGH